MHVFHKWSKWMVSNPEIPGKAKEWQYRICKVCNKAKVVHL